jgi:uncharacterized protein YegP (UPF0339 family)
MIWLSMVENQFYSIQAPLPKEKIDSLLAEIEKSDGLKLNTLVAGMAPYGRVAVWLAGVGFRTEVAWLQGEPTEVDMKDFAPGVEMSQKEYVDEELNMLNSCREAVENLRKNGLPDPMLFERYHQRFNYRFTPKFENEEAVFTGMELYYYNGELNEKNCGEHALNANRAKPYKIVFDWRVGETKYSGYFWTDEQKIIDTFADFYDTKAQQEGNFIIEVKKSNTEFRFLLETGSTVTEIPIGDMHYIIFKDKIECYRSDNYNRPEGGWRN